MTVGTDITRLCLMMSAGMTCCGTTCRRQISRRKMTLCACYGGIMMLRYIIVRVVTEDPWLPDGRIMTCVAGTCGIIISRYVIGILGTVVICEMTRIAIHRCACVFSAGMTTDACRCSMFPGQREPCRTVVECCRFPRRHRMAGETRMIERIGHVVRIGDSGEVGSMAIVTDRGRSFELPVLVAVTARYGGMRTKQRETGRCVTEC